MTTQERLQEARKVIAEIENAMERWHLGRDNDNETLEFINRILWSYTSSLNR